MFGPATTFRTAVGLTGVALAAAAAAGCGSGDSTVSKTPTAPPAGSPVAEAPASSPAGVPADPCAIDLASPVIPKAVSELPRDPRSRQPWNPEPLSGNYNECADLSAVIVRANSNVEHPSTRAVLFHRGQYLAQAVPDTYGFNAIDLSRCTDDTVVLQHDTGVPGLIGAVRFRWNGSGVEIAGNTA